MMIKRTVLAIIITMMMFAVTKADFPVNWSERSSIEKYVCDVHGNEEVPVDFILEVIDRESGFRIKPSDSKGQVGLMQITPVCAAAMNISFDDVTKYPWINIQCGVKYLIECYRKARGDLFETYRYYNKGLFWREVEAKKDSLK